MRAGFRSWWQYIRKHWVALGVVAIVLVVVITLIIAGYWFDWTGFGGYSIIWIPKATNGASLPITRLEEQQPAKTLWDWLNLLGVLAIPAVVGLGAAWYTAQQGKVSDRENKDNQREAALQAYIDKMSELLLEKHLRGSQLDDEVRKIARVRTRAVLPRLDGKRKRTVLRFLHESSLIVKNNCIVSLIRAELDEADLSEADLSEADLNGAFLRRIDLRGTNLSKANLSKADLSGVIPCGAQMDGETVLTEAKLQGAKYNTKPIQEKDAQGNPITIVPTQWPQGFDPKKAVGLICVDCRTHPIRVPR